VLQKLLHKLGIHAFASHLQIGRSTLYCSAKFSGTVHLQRVAGLLLFHGAAHTTSFLDYSNAIASLFWQSYYDKKKRGSSARSTPT